MDPADVFKGSDWDLAVRIAAERCLARIIEKKPVTGG